MLLQEISSKESKLLQYQLTFKDTCFDVFFSACTNPFCRCRTFDLNLQQNGNTKCTFSVDLNKKKLDDSKKIEPETKKLAKTILKEFTDEDWETLSNLHQVEKIYAMENIDVETIENLPDFPVDDIERDAILVPYNEIFAFEPLMISYEGINYFVDDHYCIAGSCKCTETGILFYKITDAEKPIQDNYSPMCWLDYKQNRWRYDGDKDRLKNLVHTLKETYPDLEKILKERHGVLRALYKRYKTINQITTPYDSASIAVSDKIGRNAPCPCGSGKKYKKCCAKN